jgi:hypothetical protein
MPWEAQSHLEVQNDFFQAMATMLSPHAFFT